tara:strand:- start:1263 stop:2846 length:1584 start_codon:yes stop_codon:yes gene_type:complete
LLLITGLTFVVALLRFDGPAKGYWDTYITAPAMFMNRQPVDFVLKDGSPAWDVQLKGSLPDDLVDKSSFGIITKDQRIGAPIVAAPLFAAFGLFGFRLLFALTVALLIPATVLAVRGTMAGGAGPPAYGSRPAADSSAGFAHERDAWSALAAGTLLAWNPYVLSVDRLNANLIVLPMGLLLLWLMGRQRISWLGLGLLFGALAGIRNEAICFVPAICFWLLVGREREQVPFSRRFLRLCAVGAATVVAMLPVFYWKAYALGHPFMHPSQYPHFQGFRPEFVHSLLGWEFRFNGLFNWPFHSELVRTPHFGYPTYLLFPLVTARALGIVGTALVLGGAWRLWLERRPLTLLLVLWMLPVYLLFGPQENWEEVKMTFMLLAWPPLFLFLARGLSWASQVIAAPGWRARLRLLMLVLLVGLGVAAMASVEVPQDERWYVRFPNADRQQNPAAQEGLAEGERNDWKYFQSYETEAEIARERAKLGAAALFPASYLPLDWDFRREAEEIGAELGERELRVLEIWGYIYGSRR